MKMTFLMENGRYSIAMLVYQRLTKLLICWFKFMYSLHLCFDLLEIRCGNMFSLRSIWRSLCCCISRGTHIHMFFGVIGNDCRNWQAEFIFPENSTKAGTTSKDWWCGASGALVQHEKIRDIYFYTVFPCSLQNSVAACAICQILSI